MIPRFHKGLLGTLLWLILACLGAKVVGLGSGSGPKLKVLACLGAKAVGLGRGSSRKVALARAGKRSGQEIWPESGPNPSGKALLGRGLKHIVEHFSWSPGRGTHFFYRYTP